LKTANYHQFGHSVADAFLLEADRLGGKLFEGLVNARSAFFKHLHFLVAERHVVKHYEQMVSISAAS
jgi:hypothetical protein